MYIKHLTFEIFHKFNSCQIITRYIRLLANKVHNLVKSGMEVAVLVIKISTRGYYTTT